VQMGEVSFEDFWWSTVSQDAKDLILRQLEADPRERYSAPQVSADKWLKNQAPVAPHQCLGEEQLKNMRGYAKMNKLKKMALRVVAQQIPDGEIQNLRDMFSSLDANNDGVVSFQEIQDAIKRIDGDTQGIEQLVTEIDVDWNKKINYTEFLAAALDKRFYMRDLECREAFKVFDKDNSGSISRRDLVEVLHSGHVECLVSSVAMAQILEQSDTDGDGSISLEEFLALMHS